MNWIRSDKKPNSDSDEDAYQQTKTTLSSMERNLSKLNESLKKYSKQVQAVTNNELQIFTELSSNAENDTELRFSSMTAYSELSSEMSSQATQHIEIVNDCMVAPLKKFSKLLPNEAKDAMKVRENFAGKYGSSKKTLEDMQRNRERVMQYKIDKAEKDVQFHKTEFEKSNETTVQELATLADSCEPYVGVSFAAFAKSSEAYFDANRKCCDKILEQVDNSTSENALVNRIDATFNELSGLSIVA